MKKILIFVSIFLVILKSNSQSIPVDADSQYFMTEIVRVKRQAGYVYNKPSVSFDLPPRSQPSTQAPVPTVDRTQAQMMYYAYPAPTGGGDTSNTGNNAVISGGSTGSGSGGGYNYGQPRPTGTTAGGTGSGRTRGGASQNQGAAGYGYNAPAQTAIGGGRTNAGGLTSTIAGSSQRTNSGGTQINVGTSQSIASGYSYDSPTPPPNTEGGASTNAPKYLPPIGNTGGGGGGGSRNAGATASAGSGSSGYNSGGGSSPVPQPADQYLPPLTQSNSQTSLPNPNLSINTAEQKSTGAISGPPNPEYIPPNDSPSRLPLAVADVTHQTSTGAISGPPNPDYIPPNDRPSRPSPAVADVAPRPFAPPLPSSEYLPPNENTGTSNVFTPASTYLPPVLKK